MLAFAVSREREQQSKIESFQSSYGFKIKISSFSRLHSFTQNLIETNELYKQEKGKMN